MDQLTNLPETMAAIDRFLVHHARDLSPTLIDTLLAESVKVSPVDKVVGVARVLDQNRDALPQDGAELANALAAFAALNGWHAVASAPASVPSNPFPEGYMPGPIAEAAELPADAPPPQPAGAL